VIVACASSFATAHALTEHQKPRLRCDAQPAACEHALAWQRGQRSRLARENHDLRRALRAQFRPPALATIRAVFAAAGIGWRSSEAVRVSGCETGHTWSPTIANASGHVGLFQLRRGFVDDVAQLRPYFGDADRTDPVVNAAAAAIVVRAQGWRQWSCSP
jgi:hypothetical protein